MQNIPHHSPPVLSSAETNVLRTALLLNFPDREVVLEQLSHCAISKVYDSESIEVVFNDVEGKRLSSPYRCIASFDAFREHGAYLAVEFLSWKGAIDSLYIYMPDGSELNLADCPLDDVEYDIGDYRAAAEKQIQLLYEASSSKQHEFDIKALAFQGIEQLNGRVMSELPQLHSMGHMIRLESNGEFSVKLVIDLGYSGDDYYQGVACISLLDNFFFTYVIINGIDTMRPLSADEAAFMSRFPNCVINYPNGYLLGELRNVLYEKGYRPLNTSFVNFAAKMEGDHLSSSNKVPTIYDCLFMGEGLL